MAGELEGIPNAWFEHFVGTSDRIPQGWIARDFQVAPHVFQSLLDQELTWEQIFQLNLSSSQIDEFTSRANSQHLRNNIKHVVQPTSAIRDWNLTRESMIELGTELNTWHQTEQDLDPGVSFDTRLGVLVTIARAGVEAFELPESKAAISWHMFLTKTDANYRRVLGAQPALVDLYKSVGLAVADKVERIKTETGILVPTEIVNWFNQRP